jgi:hypothetical protein
MKSFSLANRDEYVLNLLKSAGEGHQALLHRLFSENDSNPRSFLYILHDTIHNTAGSINNTWAYRVIVDTVSAYLYAYCGPASAKQLIYKSLFELCKALGAQHNIPEYSMYLEDLSEPVETDIIISIIKELHNRKGITKAELCAKYKVHPKTIQNHIHILSGKQSSNPLRIGGFAVHIPVEHHKSNSRKRENRRYYAPNTLNPVVLQMNTIQVATLLQSFHCNNQHGNIIPLDMAIDVWSQLSDYTKTRIRDVFCSKDPDFSNFIKQVDAESQSLSYQFMNEADMLRTRDTSIDEQLLIAEKGALICDIYLLKPMRSLRRQRIKYNHEQNRYYAFPADDPNGEPLSFSKDELHYLVESL